MKKDKKKGVNKTSEVVGVAKKKGTRDVIKDHVRWTEAMRVVRIDHPEVTIILPSEKIQVRKGDDVRALISPYVAIIHLALDKNVGQWKGQSVECRVKQVRQHLGFFFTSTKGASAAKIWIC